MSDVLQQWSEQICDAAERRVPLCLRGGGSKDFYGQFVHGELLDTRDYSGIVSYEPTELVVTARCGTPLLELEAELARHRQTLAFEPPHFDVSGAATIGGCIAAGLSGPRRKQVGAARDFVLGTKLLDGRGQLLEFGGQVMKNVAGYDVSRLLCGSLGTLGLIAEVSLKVLPMPASTRTLQMELDEPHALAQMNQWSRLPLPISATFWHNGQLSMRLSGACAAVDEAQQKLGGDIVDEDQADQFWRDARDQRHAFFADTKNPLWRLSLPATTPPLVLGDTAIEWSGNQRWLRTSLPADVLRQHIAAAGGSATLFRSGDKTAGVFSPLAGPLLRLHKNLKNEFDPAGIFNRGRLYSEF